MQKTERFEQYEVLKHEDGSLWELGRGAMGVTYKAFDTDLHCHVALKVIHPDILGSEGTEQRFLREARAAAQLRHPNIAAVLRLGKAADETHFYAMEFCEGETLQHYIETKGQLDPGLALEVTLQVAKGLVLAEEHHVVHRDIKPSNLILHWRRDGELAVKIIDFGLAKAAAGATNPWNTHSMHTAGFAGTAHFSSPEQIEESEVDVRSDIYSLGATLWFMLTGKPMFAGPIARVMGQHLSAPPPFEHLDPLLADSVKTLLGEMLEKNPEARPQTALDLQRKLTRCLVELRGGASANREDEMMPVRAGTVLRGRWDLIEELEAGRFRAVDLRDDRKAVEVRMIQVKETRWRQLEREAQILTRAPSSILRVVALDRAGKQPFIVFESINGFPLLTLMRRRSALSFKETLFVLDHVAAAVDYACENGLSGLVINKHDVLLSFPERVELSSRLDELLARPVTEWTDLRVVANALETGPATASEASFTSMQTVLPGIRRANSEESGETRFARLLNDAATLAYELLGGAGQRTKTSEDSYVPLARLTAEGNAILQQAMASQATTTAFVNARAFHTALTATAGYEPAWKPAAAPVSAGAAPARRAVRRLTPGSWLTKRRLVLAVGAACLLGVIVTLLSRPNDRPREVATTPAASPMPSTAPSPVAAPNTVPRAPAKLAETVAPNPLAKVAVHPKSVSPDGRYGVTVPAFSQRGEEGAQQNHLVEISTMRSLAAIPAETCYEGAGESGGIPNPRWSADGSTLAWVVEGRWEAPRAYLFFKIANGAISWQLDLIPFVHREIIAQTKMAAPDRYYEVRRRIGRTTEDSPADGFVISIETPSDRFSFPLERKVRLTSNPRGEADPSLGVPLQATQTAVIDQMGSVRFKNFFVETAEPPRTPAPQSTPVPQNSEAALKAFITAQEETEQTRNLDAILLGYAPIVDFFDHGRVDQARLRKEKSAYFERWPISKQWIVSEIETRQTASDRWSAKYRVGFRVENAKGEWIEGETENELRAYWADGRYRIDFQRGKVLRSQKGNSTQLRL